MTIAISLKVNDGLVLAADSASTLIGEDPSADAPVVVNVYNHANKIFNLRKGLPIGAITWGSGAIGTASISTLAKDLRDRFSGKDRDYPEWKIDPTNYTVEEVARRVREFMFEERYVPTFQDWQVKPALGFIVAGYSRGEAMAEEYRIAIQEDGTCEPPQPVRPKNDSGVTWSGELEAISRLVMGYGTALPTILQTNLGVSPGQVEPAMNIIQQQLAAPLVQAAMPFQDAIDLAEFLVNLTANFSRFIPGAPTVGGPIEVAAISKHEGFKWIRRKHYYSRELNSEDYGHQLTPEEDDETAIHG